MLCRRECARLNNWVFSLFHKRATFGRCTIKKVLILALLVTVSSLVFLAYYVVNFRFSLVERQPPVPSVKCNDLTHQSRLSRTGPRDHSSKAGLRIDSRVLVLVETQYSRLGTEIIHTLEANRMKYKVEPVGKSLPYLTHVDKGKYAVIIFENLNSYVNMDKWNRQLLDKYCKDYRVGMVAFVPSTDDTVMSVTLDDLQLSLQFNLAIKDYMLNSYSEIWRLTRPGELFEGEIPGDDWTVFHTNHSTHQPLAYARRREPDFADSPVKDHGMYVTAVQDLGFLDDINRVILGNGFRFWLHRLIFLDSLSFLSHGRLSVSLDRYVQIDVDDVFVGQSGLRMTPGDAEAMVASQERLQQHIRGFHFNLGFSGKFYQRGTPLENAGDTRLLELQKHFHWFDHTWSHVQPHLIGNSSLLMEDMRINANFAKDWDLPVDNQYAIAPHHSGVYPVHEPLYEAWKKVWNIRVTSTEEYLHLRPARRRQGFIHKGIMVLPRQTCGLFTHTVFLDKYPGGRERLDDSIRGGELFQTFLSNPINIFMTHMPNYGSDRLALYTFESVVKFIKCWTNLRLLSVSPLELAKKYFNMYPEEEDPVWQNPCDDKRHMEIWSVNKTCDKLPRFLVIGPQKTGTTALYTFLAMHPAILSNYKSPETFEEVQFFNGKNYYKGLDWYMNFFPVPENASAKFLFEKSATYFDNDVVPFRAYSLLPKAKLITILISPAKRAYSWYQHMRAHEDPTALNYTFYEIITANDLSPRGMRELKHRCLNPGMYAHHLEKWLDYYPARQIFIIDGEMLKRDPAQVMTKVQRYLHIEPFVDYTRNLRYDASKGFFCQIVNEDKTKCLGRSKGRSYPPMDGRAETFLQRFYRRHNVVLSKLLSHLNQPIPQWLREDLNQV
ncbi:bifunctional heparan sulfate N-deacetylase/N-sulfotransferase-like isoform X2 [Liolophura sinensis]|uniref:bifunctional heparan sulfate N-deacetylase/N-sulfotransferase-like isoform X2 n=1 Tax=Liolophura sinensis TaxID=3198878 RepID=UPI00315974B9